MTTAGRAIAWYADDSRPSLASVRLRMLLPMRELATLGVPTVRYENTMEPATAHTLVFCKCLTEAGLDVALRARRSGQRIVYDLCDNVYDAKPTRKQQERVAIMSRFLEIADEVVFSTDVLRQQVLQRNSSFTGRCRVIPDMLESMDAVEGRSALIERWQLARLHRFIRRHADALHLVWFGSNMGNLAGLVHVDAAVRELEKFSAIRPVTLTVISNDLHRYRTARRQWRLPCHYLPWSIATFATALAAHDVAIVPVKRNSYTQGKTINRPATAILAGLGVIADAIDSYEPLRPFIFLDDWQAGLAHYAATPPRSDPRLLAARHFLVERYGNVKIAAMWKDLLTLDPNGCTAAPSAHRQALASGEDPSRSFPDSSC